MFQRLFDLACCIRWAQAYRTGSQLPLAFAAGEFLETQKNAMGEFFSETFARTKQGFSLLWTNWNAVREVQARRNKGETISLHEYCMIARDKKDTGHRPARPSVLPSSPPLALLCFPHPFPPVGIQARVHTSAVASLLDSLGVPLVADRWAPRAREREV
jgi:hypothetical protein